MLLLKGEKPTSKVAEQVSVDVSEDVPGRVADEADAVDVVPVARRGWSAWTVPKEDPDTQEEGVEWVPLEPVAFLESTWNIVLVLGFTETGWLDIIIGCFLLVASASLQITFAVILLSQDFLGAPFNTNIASAEKWRVGVAHDYRHLDLGEAQRCLQRSFNSVGTLGISFRFSH